MLFPPSTTIMITGASGFVGSHACSYFAELGLNIIAVGSANKQRSVKLDPIACELTSRDQVRRLLNTVHPDYVLHLAGRNHVKDSWEDPVGFLETNLMGTIYLLDALRETSSLARVLVAGSMLGFPLGDRPSPPHPYSLSKAFQVFAAQSWASLFKLNIMVAQPANLIGPGPSNGICALLAGWIARREKGMDQDVFTLSSLTEQRDFLDVRDVVKAFGCILLQGKPGESYRTSSGTSRSLGELLEVFRRLSTVSLDTIAPRCPSNQELRLDGGRRSYAADPAIPLLDSPAEPEESPLRLLGWSPSIPFEQSITDTLHYFRNREGP